MNQPLQLLPPAAQQKAQAVEYLERLLALARDGKIAEFVMIYKDPTTRPAEWTHTWTGTENLHELIGALDVIKHRQLNRVLVHPNG